MNAICPKATKVSFHDYQPELDNFRQTVLNGLAHEHKQIPPKFFYDERGSQLFEAILEQPEYYVPHVEKQLYRDYAADMAALIGKDAVLIEPGSGSCEKVQLLLDALRPAAYVPMDISGDFLRQSAATLGAAFPWLHVHAACLDFTRELHLPQNVPAGRRVVFIPGSSLGNFDLPEAQHFLFNIAQLVGKGGGLLIGVDRKKDKAVLETAYNDAAGVTAAFNLNLLVRINNELGGTFDLETFAHYACYNAAMGRIEMHLTSLQAQQVRVSGKTFHFARGERIHTENSYKYHPEEFIALATAAGFKCEQHWTDAANLFGIYYCTV